MTPIAEGEAEKNREQRESLPLGTEILLNKRDMEVGGRTDRSF